MALRNTQTGYGWPARLLHWLIAVLVIGLFALGYWMRTLDYYDPWYQVAPRWHMAMGVGLIALIALRLVWRAVSVQPEPLAKSALTRRVAGFVHFSLYVMLVVMAVSGYLYATADGQSIDVFGLVAVPPIYTAKAVADTAGDVHEWVAYAIIALAALHALAALKHHIFDRDRTLMRMVTGPARADRGT